MFLEGGLQLADDWTFQPGMNLAPVIRRVSVAQRLVREADSTGKADPAIDYQDRRCVRRFTRSIRQEAIG